MRLSSVSIVSCLGVILSASAMVFTGATYIASSSSSAAIAALAADPDVMTRKIDALVENHEAKGLIISELKTLRQQNNSPRSLLGTMTNESRRRVRIEIVLWSVGCVFFFVLLVRNEQARRQ
jgi:hypothetical protein